MAMDNNEQLGDDLRVLFKSGLVEAHVNENGEWVFKAAEHVGHMSAEEILDVINSTLEQEGLL
jgi:hypothetical protein